MRVCEDPLSYWLALSRISQIGPKRATSLIGGFGSPQNVFSASDIELRQFGVPNVSIAELRQFNWSLVEPCLQWLASDACHHIVTIEDERYPTLLKEITDPPLYLYVKGDVDVLSLPQIAMVGARNASVNGSKTAKELARTLSRCGFVVTSGLAQGIDGAAHQGALDGEGKTVAVVGTGLCQVYPRKHGALAGEICERGALVSEFPIGTRPLAHNFPRRNRIISGLSLGTVVVEAALKSGSLISARLASEYNRQVFAVPGSIYNMQAKGCHWLIKNGAKLIESAQDIVDELGGMLGHLAGQVDDSQREIEVELSDAQRKVFELVGFEPSSVDEIAVAGTLSVTDVQQQLFHLEMVGVVVLQAGGYVRT